MTGEEICKLANEIMHLFEGMMPGDVIARQAVVNHFISTNVFKKFQIVIRLLLINDFLQFEKNCFKLTEKGYSYLHKGTSLLPLRIDLCFMVNYKQESDKIYYDLWEIIGMEKEENPFYVSGSMFYDVAKQYVQGIPPTSTRYIDDLKKKGRKNLSRIDWCKILFNEIEDKQVEPFLNDLSSKINDQADQHSQTGSPIQEEAPFESLINNIDMEVATKKERKIFISHNSGDFKGFVKPLVDMMTRLGVKEKEIFCSSYSGFGIPFGESILNCLSDQFKSFDLLVLFVHSPRYYESAYCLNEMGAAWILTKEHRSFLTTDCTLDMLKGVIKDNEIAFCAGREDTYHLLNDFKAQLEAFFSLEPKDNTRWEGIKKDFLEKVTM